MLHQFTRIIYKIDRTLSRYRQAIRKRNLRFLYKERFKYEERFSFQLTSKIIFDSTASAIHVGNGVQVRDYCYFRSGQNGKLSIGNDVFFNNGCSLNCLGSIVVGNNCQFGEGVKLYDHNHAYTDEQKLISSQGYVVGQITIGDNCWIGSNVVILKDVTVGNNVVIGAGCVIYKSIPADSVVINHQNLAIELKKPG